MCTTSSYFRTSKSSISISIWRNRRLFFPFPACCLVHENRMFEKSFQCSKKKKILLKNKYPKSSKHNGFQIMESWDVVGRERERLHKNFFRISSSLVSAKKSDLINSLFALLPPLNRVLEQPLISSEMSKQVVCKSRKNYFHTSVTSSSYTFCSQLKQQGKGEVNSDGRNVYDTKNKILIWIEPKVSVGKRWKREKCF